MFDFNQTFREYLQKSSEFVFSTPHRKRPSEDDFTNNESPIKSSRRTRKATNLQEKYAEIDETN